jgi:hypothetical protein
MKHTIGMTLTASWLVAGVTVGAQSFLTRTFDTDKAGVLPPGFTVALFRPPAGQTELGKWLLRRPGAEAYLMHAPRPGTSGYTMAIGESPAVRDLTVSVRLRLAGGQRTGGLVWRYRDVQNFYAALLDLSDGDMALYRVSSGDLITLEAEDGLELDVNAWHTLKVTHDDEDISVSLGGIRVFENNRGRNRVGGPGLVGLLASGTSEVWFDDLRAEVRHPRR